MKQKLTLLLLALFTTMGAWANVTVTIVDGTNAPFDTYGTRNTSATPNTFTSNATSGKEGLVISAPVIDRATWWSTYCLGVKNSAAQTDENVTFTAPTGYVIKNISMTVQAISSNNSYDVTVNGETTRVTGASAKEYSNITVNASSFSFTINSVSETVNWLAVKSMTVTLSEVFNPNNVAGKTFTLQCARGYVYWNGSAMKGHASNATKFAIVSYENNTYLYDATNNAFVCHTTAATAGNVGNPALESNTDFSKAVKNISFGPTNIEAYPYYVQEDQFTNWLNMDGTPNVYFNRWTNFENGNGGNTYKIEVVDTDFDQTAAVAMLNAYFNPSATVTYVISDASDVIYTSEAFSTTVGATISSLPADLQRPYCTYNVTSVTMVAGTNTVNATVTYNPPFTVSSSFDTATWYYATLRGSKYVRADESHKDGSGRYQTNSTNERTDVYKWAFVGNPYNLAIMNKGAGSTKYLNANNSTAPSMMDATPASDIKARWIATPNSNGSFAFRNESGANLYINDAGNGGNLGFWNSSSGANDAGSNWVITEVGASDKAALGDAITAAQALVNGAGVPGYINSTAATTLTSAISTAQGVYDDPSGDYGSAYNTLAAAITAASVPANINYTPRTDVYYTIVNARGAMVYDPSHSSSVDTQNGNSEYIWYGSTTPDATNPNNLWGFIERDGNYYMYNVGKRQFASVGNGTYGSTWIFSNTPAYITLDDGIADEIVPPGVRVRATIATTGNSYTMSVSTSYTGPVITYDGNGDGGVPMVFAESSYAIDADVTSVIEALIEDLTPYRNALKDVIDGCAGIEFGSGLNQYSANATYTTALAAANAAYEDVDATKSELQTAKSNLESAISGLTINLPGAGFYRIKGNTSGNYLAAGIANSKYAMTSATDATTIFYYDGTKLTNLSSGMCNGVTSSSWDWVVGASASTVTFCDGHTSGGYGIQTANVYFYDGGTNADRGQNVNMESDNTRYRSWYLTEITTLPVTISAARYATLYAPVALTIPGGVQAYYISSLTTTEATLTEIETTIAANTPVILKATAGTYDFVITTGGTDVSATNKLAGQVTAFAVSADDVTNKVYYTLQQNVTGDAVGLFPKTAAGSIAGFKAYLPAANFPSAGVKGFTFIFDDDATGINEELRIKNEESSIYNLAGQRINKMQKGINIVNGKKILK